MTVAAVAVAPVDAIGTGSKLTIANGSAGSSESDAVVYGSHYGQPPAAAAVTAAAMAAPVQQQQEGTHQFNHQSQMMQYIDAATAQQSASLGLQSRNFLPAAAGVYQQQIAAPPSSSSLDGNMLIHMNGLYYPFPIAGSAANNTMGGVQLLHNAHQQQQQQHLIQQHILQQQQQQQHQQQQQMLLSAATAAAALPAALGATNFAVPKLPTEVAANVPVAATAAASFEGVPIFIVPQSGTLSLNALQRANEFKLAQLAGSLMSTPKLDTSKHFHVFVGDLSSEVDNKMLKEAFDKCGTISEAKVIRDPQSLKSRGYGFVSFPEKKDAQRAIDEMNGVLVGRRAVRTNWASRRAATGSATGSITGGASEDEKTADRPGSNRTAPVGTSDGDEANRAAALERLIAATDADNTTVYVGNLTADASGENPVTDVDKNREEELREAFKRFGDIKEVRLFLAQNYGFVIFDQKKSAANAILQMNGAELRANSGRRLRCSWGRAGLGGGSSNTSAQHEAASLSALATAQLIAAQYAASQNNQSIAAAAQNANALLAAQMSAASQQQQQQQQIAVAYAAAAAAAPTQTTPLLPYYATSGANALDAMTIGAAASMAANTLYSTQHGAWHA